MKEIKDKLNNFIGFSVSDNTYSRIEEVFNSSVFLFSSISSCYRDIFIEGLTSFENRMHIKERSKK